MVPVRALALASLALAGVGCTSSEAPSCPASTISWSSHVCVDLDPAWAQEIGLDTSTPGPVAYQGSFTVTAQMVASVSGGETARCAPSAASVPAGWTNEFWQVRDAKGRMGVVALMLPKAIDYPTTGAAIEVRRLAKPSPFFPALATSIRVAGALVVFDQDAEDASSDFTSLASPELSFARGPEACGGSDSCGSWTGFSLEATSGSSTSSLPPGTAAHVGRFEIEFHDWSADAGTSSCADWGMSYRRWLAYLPAGAT